MLKTAIQSAGHSHAAVAQACGVSPAAVSHWIKAGKVPAHHVPRVSRMLGIPPEELRPDLYAPIPQPAEAAQ